jgi:regulator of replication initiation timing
MKTLIKIIIGIALLCAGWYLSTWFYKPKVVLTKSPIAKIKEKEIQTEAAAIKKAVDRNGLKHTIFKMVKEIDQSAVDAVKADLLDTAEQLGIARDQLKQVMVVNTNLTITNQRLERKVSQLTKTYSHADDHFRLSINVPNDTLQDPTFDAGYDADLITSQYNKKKWLFLKDPYIDIYSNDPRFTIKGARTLTIKPKASGFGLSGVVVSDYNQFAGPSAGTGLNLRMGKISLKGNYQYYIDHKRWAANYGVRFRLIGQD